MEKLPGRNEPCPCGSGLKFKKCHGDPVLKQKCQQAAVLMLLHEITPRRLAAGLIEQEEHDVIMSRVSTALIEMVTGENEEHQVVESEDRKREVVETLNTVKLVRCPKCGRPVPAGTKCVKCQVEVPS